MTIEKRIRNAWIGLGITVVSVVIRFFTASEDSLFDFLKGFELVFILIAIGYSAKIVGSMGIEKKHKNQGFVILGLSSLIAVYVYIL